MLRAAGSMPPNPSNPVQEPRPPGRALLIRGVVLVLRGPLSRFLLAPAIWSASGVREDIQG